MTQRAEIERLVERLRRQAEQTSKIHREMAEAKSLRQAGNPEGRTDLYMWPTPEQTTEGQAADALSGLIKREEELREALDGVLASSGARGRYHALEYADAVEKAEIVFAALNPKTEGE